MFSTMSPYSVISSHQRLVALSSRPFSSTQRSSGPLRQVRDRRLDARVSEKCKPGVSVHASFKQDDSDDDDKSFELVRQVSAPVAALLVCALVSGAVIPDEALAARSGGRMGGSSFRSRAPSMPRGGGGYRQYNYYSSPGIAPPLVGGYGYGLMPSFFFPIGFGGIFNIFIALFVISSVFNAIKSSQQRKDDEDDFDDMM